MAFSTWRRNGVGGMSFSESCWSFASLSCVSLCIVGQIVQRAPQRLLFYNNKLRNNCLTTNRAVGSSNLSGRAIKNKGLPIPVGPLFYRRGEIVTSFVTISKSRSIRAAASDKCSGAKCAYRSTISYDFQTPHSISSCRLVPLISETVQSVSSDCK